ncbi:MAG TPA: TolC family protein, partial [Mariprofundaceae bacterium]|nr:TolC family protein [Mariprofundaceae bacterium]
EMAPQVGSLPDPVLSVGAISLPVDSWSMTREAMTQVQLGLSQGIPFPGKLALRSEAARQDAAAAALDADEFSLGLIRNVRIRWWNLVYLDRALEIVDSNKKLLRQFIHVAEVKYQVGKGLQQDVLLAQLELSRLTDAEIGMKAARQNEQAALDALLNRPASDAIAVPKQVDEALPQLPDEDALLAQALASRPLLARDARVVEAADARVALAKKGYEPDFKLGAAYGFRQGTNPVGGQRRPDLASVTLSMTLPFFTGAKQDGELAQRRAEQARAEYRRQDAMQAVRAEVVQALADYRQAREQVLLYKSGIVPQASQTVASMMAGYQVNKVDFLNLIRAQITLYNYETQYWKALTGARQDLARLAAAVGKEIAHE